jgi:hypothetical protein
VQPGIGRLHAEGGQPSASHADQLSGADIERDRGVGERRGIEHDPLVVRAGNEARIGQPARQRQRENGRLRQLDVRLTIPGGGGNDDVKAAAAHFAMNLRATRAGIE